MSSEELRLTKLSILNFEQIDNLEIQPGAITVISGANDTGKTSVLNAIRSISDMAHNPAMVRQGAEKAVVTMALSDGSSVTNTITRDKMSVVIRNAEGKVLPKPATLVAGMFDGVSYDPMRFLRMAKKDRAAYIEKLMPMSVTKAEILKCIENRAHVARIEAFLREQQYDLGALGAVRAKCYEDRSLANRDIKRLDGTILTLKQSLPAGWQPGGDLQAELEAAKDLVANRKDAVAALRDRAADDARAKANEIDRCLAEEIERLRAAAAERKEAITADLEQTRAQIAAAHQPGIDEAMTALGQIQQRFADQSRLETVSRDLERHNKEAQDCLAEVTIFESCMEAIDRARAARLKQTPIEGLAVIDGDVMYKKPEEEEAIPYDLHNQQTQMLLALRIAALGSKLLPLIIFDGFESFDSQNRSALIERLRESGYQILAGQVTDSPLTVEQVA